MTYKYYFEKRSILLVGATGLIGTEVYNLYKKEGHTIKILSTNREFVEANDHAFYWNIDEKYVDERAFEGVEVMVNLAGANIAEGLWTESRKKLIYDSRVLGTKLLAKTCKKIGKKLMFYIGASAIGYYGPNNTQEPKIESDPKGDGFLADVCADWEKEHKKFKPMTEIFVIARLANVFSPKGGFLFPFIKLSQYGLRVIFGNNNYTVSWIHIEDVARFMSCVLFMDIKGIFNITVTDNKWKYLQNYLYDQFGDQIIRFTIPNFLIKLILREMSTLMLDGNYASGDKLEEASFMIKHIELDHTIKDICDNL